jgi:hypothetical protein
MNHRPFEDWLLDDQPLNPSQKRELDTHLRACKVCSGIAESNLALRSARVIAPARLLYPLPGTPGPGAPRPAQAHAY